MSNPVNFDDLFADDERLSQRAKQIMIAEAAPNLAAGLGVGVANVRAAQQMIVATIVDDSYSIHAAHQEQVIIDGHNQMLHDLAGAQGWQNILAMTRYLNGMVLFPYTYLDQVMAEPACMMSQLNYRPQGGTPLYDIFVSTLTAVMQEVERMEDDGTAVRSVTVLITDGMDEGSVRHRAADARAVVESMLATEMHTIIALGIGANQSLFRDIFRQMGIPDPCVFTPGAAGHDIRQAFNVVSQSVKAVSQTGKIILPPGTTVTTV